MASPSEFHHSEFGLTAADFALSYDDEEEEEEDEDDEESDEEEEEDEEYLPGAPPPRVSPEPPRNPTSDSAEVIVIADSEPQNHFEDDGNKRRRTEGGEASSSSLGSQGNEFSGTDIDGLICPICMDVWTNNGEHHICCLPCGHIYGMSCIKKWLQHRRKCPQCNNKCSLKDVRKLYASRLVAVDGEVHKRIRSLEAKCAALESKDGQFNKKEAEWKKRVAALESKDGNWKKKEAEWKKRETALHLDVQNLTKRNTYLEQLLLDVQNRQSEMMDGNVNSQWGYEYERNWGPKSDGKGLKSLQKESKSHEKGSFCNFEFQTSFYVDGARLFDMDTSNDVLLIARKPKAIGGVHLLTKMSLISPFEMEDIFLPSNTNGIRDLHISPSDNRLALYASVGKKLSVLSLDSSNIVVNYDLQNPAWSCSWDLNSRNYIYAGLQNGSVMVFDLRQTSGPVKSLDGLSRNLVHTVQSLEQTSSHPSGAGTILSASSGGIYQWNIDSEEGPFVVPETDNQGVCISLAYCSSSDDIVGSYRPTFDMSKDMPFTQPLVTPSQVFGQAVQGSHVLFKGMGSHHFQKTGSAHADVSKIRLPKCVIIGMENQSRFFASGDEVTNDLVLYELPSFRVHQQFKMPAPARDVRYSTSHGVLGCLSDDSLQLFHTNCS